MKKQHTLTNRENIVEMLYPSTRDSQGYGLDLYRMAAYIEYLTKRYTEWRTQAAAHEGTSVSATPSVPMKALVYSTAGFFWPCADLLDLADVVRLLLGHEPAVKVASTLIASGYPAKLSAFDHKFPAKKATRAADRGTPAVKKAAKKMSKT